MDQICCGVRELASAVTASRARDAGSRALGMLTSVIATACSCCKTLLHVSSMDWVAAKRLADDAFDIFA